MLQVWRNKSTDKIALGGAAKYLNNRWLVPAYLENGKAHVLKLYHFTSSEDESGKWERVFESQHFTARKKTKFCKKCHKRHDEELL